MNKNDILALYDEQERKNINHPSYRRESTPEIVRHISTDPSRKSFIIHSELTAKNVDRIIQEQINWYIETINGIGMEWKTFDHDEPPDLKQRLTAHGFVADEVEALLAIDLYDCPPVYLVPVAVDIRLIRDVTLLKDVTAVQSVVYGNREKFAWLEKELLENMTNQPEFWSVYIAYVNDVPACAAWVSFPPHSQFAGLWGGATMAKYRNMGLYTAVVAARAQEAINRGYRFLTVDAGPMSRPILEKRGFQLLTFTTPFIWNNRT